MRNKDPPTSVVGAWLCHRGTVCITDICEQSTPLCLTLLRRRRKALV